MIAPEPAQLRAALGVERWVADVAAAGPFPDLAGLLAAADAASASLTPGEVGEALAHHPRIGERAAGTDEAAAHSRREQAAADADAGDTDLAARLAAGNRAYEERFGRIFLIRALGRSRAEILAELDRRLALDDAADLRIVGQQLGEIARLRLEAMFA